MCRFFMQCFCHILNRHAITALRHHYYPDSADLSVIDIPLTVKDHFTISSNSLTRDSFDIVEERCIP